MNEPRCIVGAVAALALAAVSGAQNYVVNGDFENGTTPWEGQVRELPGGMLPERLAADGDPCNYVRLDTDMTGSQDVILRQRDITIPGNIEDKYVVLDFDARVVGEDDNATVAVEITGAANILRGIPLNSEFVGVPDDCWKHYAIATVVTTPLDVEVREIKFSLVCDTATTLDVDNVALTVSDTDASDLAILLGAWGSGCDPSGCPSCQGDIATLYTCTTADGRCRVGPKDLATLLGAWGPCSNPNGDGPTVSEVLELCDWESKTKSEIDEYCCGLPSLEDDPCCLLMEVECDP